MKIELCNTDSSVLVVTIDGTMWKFPPCCLSSGDDNLSRDDVGWLEHLLSGPWSINKWPEGFPEDQKKAVQDALNAELTLEEYDSLSEE